VRGGRDSRRARHGSAAAAPAPDGRARGARQEKVVRLRGDGGAVPQQTMKVPPRAQRGALCPPVAARAFKAAQHALEAGAQPPPRPASRASRRPALHRLLCREAASCRRRDTGQAPRPGGPRGAAQAARPAQRARASKRAGERRGARGAGAAAGQRGRRRRGQVPQVRGRAAGQGVPRARHVVLAAPGARAQHAGQRLLQGLEGAAALPPP